MESKRPGSPLTSSDGHQAKRARVEAAPQLTPVKQCLHCDGAYHNWVECTAVCKHCSGHHPRKRCPLLGVKHYTPGGFHIIGAPRVKEPRLHNAVRQSDAVNTVPWSSPQSINAPTPAPDPECKPATYMNIDKTTTTATTPVYEPPPKSTVPIPIRALDPQRSGSNQLPLPSSIPLSTSVPPSGPTAMTRPVVILADLQRLRYNPGHKERQTWNALQHHIRRAVEDTAYPGKPGNDTLDRVDAHNRMSRAFNFLRAIILGTAN